MIAKISALEIYKIILNVYEPAICSFTNYSQILSLNHLFAEFGLRNETGN